VQEINFVYKTFHATAVSIIPTFAPSTSSSEIVSTSVTPTSTQPGTVTDLTARTTATMTNQIQTTPTSSSVGVATGKLIRNLHYIFMSL